MLRRTYGSVKSELAAVCGASGASTSDTRVLAYANAATEELVNAGDWPTIIDRLKFKITEKHIVLPSDYDRMLYFTMDGIPQQMQSPWYEFVGYGLELQTAVTPSNSTGLNWYEGVLDKDTVATFRHIPDDQTYYPRVYGRTDERVDGVRPEIVIQGYDVDGNWIRTSDGAGGFIDGFSIPINGDTAPYWIQSTQSVSYVTAITKPQTKGNVLLYAANLDGSTQHYIGGYAPRDTTPIYRQYSVSWLPDDNTLERTVLARCRRRYVPIEDDADFLLISNLPALKKMVQAVWYGIAKQRDDYIAYRSDAISLLKEEAKAYIGLQRQKPIMTISEGAGMRRDGVYIL